MDGDVGSHGGAEGESDSSMEDASYNSKRKQVKSRHRSPPDKLGPARKGITKHKSPDSTTRKRYGSRDKK